MVQSLARPGGNMTGLADLTLDLNAKRVQLLKETLPGVRLVSTLSTPDVPGTERSRAEIDEAASTLGLQVRHFTVRARLANLATKHQLPGMYPIRAQVEAGGLISYGADQTELVIKLKTATGLGLTIPRAVRLQADHLIE